jgi:hypothetical protein
VGFADEVAKIKKAREGKATLKNLTPTEGRELAVSAIGDLLAAKRLGQTQSQASKAAGITHVSALVEQARIMKTKAAPMVACYNKAGDLIAAVAPDDIVDIPAGSAVFDAQGVATGIVDGKGHITMLSQGPAAVAAVAKSLASQAIAATKGRKVVKAQTHRPQGTDAFSYLVNLGTNCVRATVQKAKAAGEAPVEAMPPLIAAACFYEESSAAVKKAIRARLSQCAPESQSAARLALQRVNRNFAPEIDATQAHQPVAKGLAGQADAMRLANETARWMTGNGAVSKALNGAETPIQVLKRGWPKLNPDEQAHFRAQRAKCSEWSRLRLHKLIQRTTV